MSTNPTPQSTTKTPKLRFPEFKDPWVEKKLGEVLDYEQPTKYLVSSTEYDKKFTTPVLTAGKTFILGYTDEEDGIFKDKLPVIIFDDFTTATQFVDFPFKAKSSAMKILHAKEYSNIKFAYETMQILDYEIGGHERHWISKHSQLIVNTPSLPEQTKIAEFLTAVDDKITLLGNQKKQLKLYKKGLLQALFPSSNNRGGGRTVRFLDIGGVSFPDWAEKRLGDEFTYIVTNSFSRDNLNYIEGNIKNIHYGDIHTKFQSNFKLEKEKVPFINFELEFRIKPELFCQVGDIIMADASEDKSDIGKSIEITEINNQKLVAGLHTLHLRPIDQYGKGYLGYLFNNSTIKVDIQKLAVGAKVLGISKFNLSKITYLSPQSINEQTKIADFLTSIDDKIAVTSDQITQTELWKKGLLQVIMV